MLCEVVLFVLLVLIVWVCMLVCVFVLCVRASFATYGVVLYGLFVALVCDCVCLCVCVRSMCSCFECGLLCDVVCFVLVCVCACACARVLCLLLFCGLSVICFVMLYTLCILFDLLCGVVWRVVFCYLCLFACVGVFNACSPCVRRCVMPRFVFLFFLGGDVLCVCEFACGLFYAFVCCACDLLCDDDCFVLFLYVQLCAS